MYGFSYDSDKKYFDKVVDLGYGNSFQLLTPEHLVQVTIFEEMVVFDIYRDPKKYFSPLILYLHDWQKMKQLVIDCTRKKNGKFNRIT